ncbi:uncharacterized protein LOC128228408 [Mya arenaria]|uniref:uncharacterized protein LOC128228408 n=1 Tax=Mya arenaria TaxID=6604 RepID=UPI0022E3A3A9|nr:uncharacterized protein LOC128228408 [Mya arenaria]
MESFILGYFLHIHTEHCCDMITYSSNDYTDNNYGTYRGDYGSLPGYHIFKKGVDIRFLTDGNDEEYRGFAARGVALKPYAALYDDFVVKGGMLGLEFEATHELEQIKLWRKSTSSGIGSFNIHSKSGKQVQLVITYLDMKSTPNCTNDFITVYTHGDDSDGKRLLHACRDRVSAVHIEVISLKSSLYVEFRCGNNIEYTEGFCAVINFSEYTSSNIAGCLQLPSFHELVSDKNGNISSKSTINSAVKSGWYFKSDDKDMMITFTVQKNELINSPNCVAENVSIFIGKVGSCPQYDAPATYFCGGTIGELYTVPPGHIAVIQFNSEQLPTAFLAEHSLSSERAFSIQYSFTKPVLHKDKTVVLIIVLSVTIAGVFAVTAATVAGCMYMARKRRLRHGRILPTEPGGGQSYPTQSPPHHHQPPSYPIQEMQPVPVVIPTSLYSGGGAGLGVVPYIPSPSHTDLYSDYAGVPPPAVYKPPPFQPDFQRTT